METQSAADLRNLLAPGTENREVNIDAQTVIMFLSFYLMCFFPLKQPLSHVGVRFSCRSHIKAPNSKCIRVAGLFTDLFDRGRF